MAALSYRRFLSQERKEIRLALGPLSSSRGRNVLAVQLLVAGDTEPFTPIVPDKVFKASSLNCCFEITVAPGP
ncbi:hypothetical protein K0M31_007377, partial [Melipona bicolor]